MNNYVTIYGTTTTCKVRKYIIFKGLQGLCYTTENPRVRGSIPRPTT